MLVGMVLADGIAADPVRRRRRTIAVPAQSRTSPKRASPGGGRAAEPERLPDDDRYRAQKAELP